MNDVSLKNSINNYVGDFIMTNKRLGKGNFASVYVGYHKISKLKVAIKKIEVDNIFKLKKHVKREIELHKKLKHANIVALYDVIYDEDSHTIYLIMELCEKGNLATFQKKRPMKEYHIQRYINRLASGLKYLRENNVIHRDLKPQNLLITSSNEIKISDFGLAKEFNLDMLKHTYCGSPLYMSPEVIRHQKYNDKSDLWSVGIIIYEMIVGVPPYHVKNFYQLAKKIDADVITIPEKYKKYTSKELQNLLSNLLKKEPNARISWEEFFNHPWITNTIEMQEQNQLLEISISSNKSMKPQSLPTIKSRSFFQSFNSNNNQIKDKLKNSDGMSFKLKSSITTTDKEKEIEEFEKEFINEIMNLTDNMINNNSTSLDYKSLSNNASINDDYKSINKTNNNLNLSNSYIKVNKEGEEIIDKLENKRSSPIDIKNNNININDSGNNMFREVVGSALFLLKESYSYLSSNKKSI